jgi:hypothetical protein
MTAKQFQRLITDLEKRHDFQAVLVLAHKPILPVPVLEANHYWFLLDRAGVHLATVAQGGRIGRTSAVGSRPASSNTGTRSIGFKLSADVKRGQRAVLLESRPTQRLSVAAADSCFPKSCSGKWHNLTETGGGE